MMPKQCVRQSLCQNGRSSVAEVADGAAGAIGSGNAFWGAGGVGIPVAAAVAGSDFHPRMLVYQRP